MKNVLRMLTAKYIFRWIFFSFPSLLFHSVGENRFSSIYFWSSIMHSFHAYSKSHNLNLNFLLIQKISSLSGDTFNIIALFWIAVDTILLGKLIFESSKIIKKNIQTVHRETLHIRQRVSMTNLGNIIDQMASCGLWKTNGVSKNK